MTPDNSSWLDSDDALKRLVALKRAGLSVEQLRTALNDEDPRVREAAALHGDLTDGLLHEAIRHPDLATRRTALRHPGINEAHLDAALHDPEVRDIVSAHHKLTEPQKNRIVADPLTEPGLREAMTKAVSDGIGYIHFPGLGQVRPVEAMPSTQEQMDLRLRLRGHQPDASLGVTLGRFPRGDQGFTRQSPHRGVSISYNHADSQWHGTRAHETQHGVFNRIAQDFGSGGRDNVLNHLHSKLNFNEKRALHAIVGHPDIVGIYTPDQLPEEKICYAQSYINDPEFREATHRNLKLRTPERKYAFQALVRSAVQKMRLAASNLRHDDLGLVKKSEEEMLKAWTAGEHTKLFQPELPNDWTRFTKIETFRPKMGLYHHVYHMPHFEEEGYTPMMHVISTKPSPFDKSGMVSSATVGLHKEAARLKKEHGYKFPLKGEVAQIHSSATVPGLRGHGYGGALYGAMARYHRGLVSDMEVSPAATRRWQALHATPGFKGALGRAEGHDTGSPGIDTARAATAKIKGSELHWAHSGETPTLKPESVIDNPEGHQFNTLSAKHGGLTKASPPPSFPRLGITNRRETQIVDDPSQLYAAGRRAFAADAQTISAGGDIHKDPEPGGAESRAKSAKGQALSFILNAKRGDPGMAGWSLAHRGGYQANVIGSKMMPRLKDNEVRANQQHEDLHGVFALVERKYGKKAREMLAHRIHTALPAHHQHAIDEFHHWQAGTWYRENAPSTFTEEKLASLLGYMNSTKERDSYHSDHDDVQRRVKDNTLKAAYKNMMAAAQTASRRWLQSKDAEGSGPEPIAKAEPLGIHEYWDRYTRHIPRGVTAEVPTEHLWVHDQSKRFNPETGEAHPIGHLRSGIDPALRWKGLLDSVKERGIEKPIEVVEQDEKPYIVDGHHRLGVAMALKHPTVPVTTTPELAQKMGWKIQKSEDRPSVPLHKTTSPEFKQWFGQSQVKHPETGAPLRVYHGTTHNFNSFGDKKFNPEAHYGAGHYFSDSPEDVERNYANPGGADLRGRIEQETERLHGNTGITEAQAAARARRKLVGPAARTIPAYLSMQNPLHLRPDHRAHPQRPGSYPATRWGIDQDYNPDTDEYGEPTGSGMKLHAAIHAVSQKHNQEYGANYDPDEMWSSISEHAPEIHEGEGSANAHKIFEHLKIPVLESAGYDANGNNMGSQFLGDVARHMGYDGIIHDADRFSGMEGTEGANHYIAFDPRQIKSVFNRTWDPKSKQFGKEEPDETESPDEVHDWDQPIPNQHELAMQSIQRMRPEKRDKALAFFHYATGKTDQRPSVEPELERHLATFGVVDPQGYPFDEEGYSLDKPIPGKRTKGGEQPAALKEHRLRSTWAGYHLPYQKNLMKFEDQMQAVAVQQAGASAIHGPLCRAAAFLSGQLVDEDRFRRALALDLEPDEAALKAAGLEPTPDNLKALHALVEIQSQEGLHKGEDHRVSANGENKAMADKIIQAFDTDDVRPVSFKGKHTGGMQIARDEEGQQWLLKPGSGSLSPAAGVREETASQSDREKAFYDVGNDWGLGQWMPKTFLVNVDGQDTAVMELLPLDWKNLEKLRDENPHQLVSVLEKLLHAGILHRWAVLDYVLGNPDRHGNNIMVGAEEDGFPVKLIDHGSTFAGEAFNPSRDSSSFIPFYLRGLVGKRWKTMSDQDRLQAMPKMGVGGDEELREWILGLNSKVLVDVLSRHGLRAEPSLERLQKLRAGVDHADSASRVVDQAWLGL